MSLTLEQVAVAAKAVNVSEQVYMLLQIMNALGGGTPSGDITKLAATNLNRGYALEAITGGSTAYLTAINLWRTNNPTFIPLAYERVTLDDGDFLLINYTV